MYKIYSRKRFIIKPWANRGLFEHTNNPRNLKKIKIIRRNVYLVIVVILAVIIQKLIMGYINPVFETLCYEKAKSIATIISNQESTVVMNKYKYDDLYTIDKDENGDITIIKSNVVPINNMISDLTEAIQKRFNELEKSTIDIPVGNLLGVYYFSGLGPSIHTKIITTGTLDTEVQSEFIARGINQTLHRVYVNFECNIKFVTPIKNFEKQITNQVIIAEQVIIGNIPDSYYNFEGTESSEAALNVIE